MKCIAASCLILLAACQMPTSNPSGKKADTLITANTAKIAPGTPTVTDTTTLSGKWYLQPVLPSDTATGKTPFLQFDLAKSRFSGNTGCNPLHGEFYYGKKDSSLSFGNKIAITKMTCPGYNEMAFLKSLGSTGRFRLQNGTLTLLSDDKTELSHWTRKPGSGPKALKA